MPNTSTKSKKSKPTKNTKSVASTRSTRSKSADSINTIDETFSEIVQVQSDVHLRDDRSMRQPTVKGKGKISQSDEDSDRDSGGVSDEDSAGEGPQISTGYVIPRPRYFHKLTDRPSLKSDQQSWTQFNGGLIYFAYKFTYGRINLESTTKTWCKEDDLELFEIIRICIQIDKLWKLIEVIPHGSGFKAYKALKLHFEGNETRQYRSAMKKVVSCKMGENEIAEDYMIRVLKTEKDAIDHNIYKVQSNGACPVVITNSLDKLPRRYQNWAIAKRHAYDNGGYPTTREYLEELVAYEENEISQNRMVLPINVFNNDTYNDREPSFNSRNRNYNSQGRSNYRYRSRTFNSQGRRGHYVPARGSGHSIPRSPHVNHRGRGGGYPVPRSHPYTTQQGNNPRRQQHHHQRSNKRQHRNRVKVNNIEPHTVCQLCQRPGHTARDCTSY